MTTLEYRAATALRADSQQSSGRSYAMTDGKTCRSQTPDHDDKIYRVGIDFLTNRPRYARRGSPYDIF